MHHYELNSVQRDGNVITEITFYFFGREPNIEFMRNAVIDKMTEKIGKRYMLIDVEEPERGDLMEMLYV